MSGPRGNRCGRFSSQRLERRRQGEIRAGGFDLSIFPLAEPTRFAYDEVVSRSLSVRCYSGRKADERPTRFTLGKREYLVEEILDQWYGPDRTYFKVLADDGDHYILSHDERSDEDSWRLESFRRVQS